MAVESRMLTKMSTRMPCCKNSDPFLPEFLMEDENILPLVLHVLDSEKFNSLHANPSHIDDTDVADDNSQDEEMIPSPNIYLSEDSEESVSDDDVQLEYTNLDDFNHSFKVLIHKDVKGPEGPLFSSASQCRFQQQQPQQQTTARPQHQYVQPTTHQIQPEDGVLDPIECFSRCDPMNAPPQYQTRDHPEYSAYTRQPYSSVDTNTHTLEQLKVNLDENETSDSSSTISPNSDLSNFEPFPPSSDWYPHTFETYPCSPSFQTDLTLQQAQHSPSKRVAVDDLPRCSRQYQSCGPSYCANLQHSARESYCRTYSVDGNNNAPQCYMPRQIYTQRKPKRAAGKSKRLWEFVRQLLLCKKYTKYIQWEDKHKGIFKIKRSSKVAELWGAYKENPKMNYEKFSRALRHYYKTNVFIRHEHRLTYQFGPKSKGWRQGEVTSCEPPLFHDKHSAKCGYE